MKLLVDMNLSPRWVNLLIDSGWQAIRFRARFGSCRSALMFRRAICEAASRNRAQALT
jgi:predicted nuclease of predicted toxin-antitoxin system